VGRRRDGGAIDEDLAGRTLQQVVLFARKDFEHGPVICDHREDQVRLRGDSREGRAGLGPEFRRQFFCHLRPDVIHDGDLMAGFLETKRHIGAHAAEADDADSFHDGITC